MKNKLAKEYARAIKGYIDQAIVEVENILQEIYNENTRRRNKQADKP